MAGHGEEDHEAAYTVARGVNWLLAFLALVTLAFGLYGFGWIGPASAGCGGEEPWWFFGWFYRTVALFEFAEANLHIAECYPYGVLAIARVTGPAATILFVARVLVAILRDPFDRLRLRWFGRHTVILGFGRKGQVRAIEAVRGYNEVVAVDNAADETAQALARRYRIVLLRGDARRADILQRAGVHRAAEFVVATGDDAQNLSVAQSIGDRLRTLPEANRRVDVSLSDPLLRRLLDGGADGGPIEPFCVEDTAAYLLCEAVRFFEIADLFGQRRVHLLMVGFGRLGVSLVAQLLRSGATADMDGAKLSIVAADPAAARHLLRLSHPGAEQVADIGFYAGDSPDDAIAGSALLAEREAAAPLTAIVVLDAGQTGTLAAAVAMRDHARLGVGRAIPIFFGFERRASLLSIAHPLPATKRFSDVLHPFEVSADLCLRRVATRRDQIAQTLHEAYRQAFQQLRDQGQRPSSSADALVPWAKLPRTYRQANRRAADHIAAKLFSAGCFVPHGELTVPEHFDLLCDPGALERLADLEHRAWAIDRQLDGWRAGSVRDDALKIHDCLKPYDELAEPTKELDRAQIRELNEQRLPRRRAWAWPSRRLTPLVRFDLWIGVIGAGSINRDEAGFLQAALEQTILPPILAAGPEHHVTVLCPLAPGSELIATKTILACLADGGRQHRLIVVEAVRPATAIDDFEPCWQNGAVGDAELSSGGLTWPQARGALLTAVEGVRNDPVCERILELDSVGPGSTMEQRQAGYRSQNSYIVQRAHVVIAIAKATAAPPPSGTEEAIAWRRDRAAIPPAMPRFLPRPNRSLPRISSLIVVDMDQRIIRDDP